MMKIAVVGATVVTELRVGSSVMNRRLEIGRERGIGVRSAQQVQRHFDHFIVRCPA